MVPLVQLVNVAPGQQLYYYGGRVWPDSVRKSMYDQFGGMPKDLNPSNDYDPKVLFSSDFQCCSWSHTSRNMHVHHFRAVI